MLGHVSAFAASRTLSTTPLETEEKGGNEDFVARKLDDSDIILTVQHTLHP